MQSELSNYKWTTKYMWPRTSSSKLLILDLLANGRTGGLLPRRERTYTRDGEGQQRSGRLQGGRHRHESGYRVQPQKSRLERVATIESTICRPETTKSGSKLLDFAPLSRTGMWSQLIDGTRVDFALEVGSATESVEVEAQLRLVDTHQFITWRGHQSEGYRQSATEWPNLLAARPNRPGVCRDRIWKRS